MLLIPMYVIVPVLVSSCKSHENHHHYYHYYYHHHNYHHIVIIIIIISTSRLVPSRTTHLPNSCDLIETQLTTAHFNCTSQMTSDIPPHKMPTRNHYPWPSVTRPTLSSLHLNIPVPKLATAISWRANITLCASARAIWRWDRSRRACAEEWLAARSAVGR